MAPSYTRSVHQAILYYHRICLTHRLYKIREHDNDAALKNGKVLKFAQNGTIRDIGGFTGGLSECSQIQ